MSETKNMQESSKIVNFTNQLKNLETKKKSLKIELITTGVLNINNASKEVSLERSKAGLSRYAYAAMGYKVKSINNAKASLKMEKHLGLSSKIQIKKKLMSMLKDLEKFKVELESKLASLVIQLKNANSDDLKYKLKSNISKIETKIRKVILYIDDIKTDMSRISSEVNGKFIKF